MSDVAVGAMLLQENEAGQMKSCAYTSRKMSATEKMWTVWEEETYAVHWTLLIWRHFLEGSKVPFEVQTDHKKREISMDFIVELPESPGNTVIWVITKLFSKQMHLSHQRIPSAWGLDKLFLYHVYRLHGALQNIISHRGGQFTSKFWSEFLKLLGDSSGVSSSHPPSTNWLVWCLSAIQKDPTRICT